MKIYKFFFHIYEDAEGYRMAQVLTNEQAAAYNGYIGLAKSEATGESAAYGCTFAVEECCWTAARDILIDEFNLDEVFFC